MIYHRETKLLKAIASDQQMICIHQSIFTGKLTWVECDASTALRLIADGDFPMVRIKGENESLPDFQSSVDASEVLITLACLICLLATIIIMI